MNDLDQGDWNCQLSNSKSHFAVRFSQWQLPIFVYLNVMCVKTYVPTRLCIIIDIFDWIMWHAAWTVCLLATHRFSPMDNSRLILVIDISLTPTYFSWKYLHRTAWHQRLIHPYLLLILMSWSHFCRQGFYVMKVYANMQTFAWQLTYDSRQHVGCNN